MDLSELDRMIAERNGRIEKRKADGTLFEEEVAKTKKPGSEDARLDKEVKAQKNKMAERVQSRMPPCPQCGKKMTFMPEESMVVCQTCQIGMQV